MAISRIVIQPINELDADTQFNTLLNKYDALLHGDKADPLKEVVFYPFDREMYTYTHTCSLAEILRHDTHSESISLLLPTIESMPEFLLLNSLGLSDEDIRKHFNNE